MGRLVKGIVALPIGAIIVMAAWLLWPLPSNQFSWRTQVDSYVEQGRCYDASRLLIMVYAAVDDEVALEFLRALPEVENCVDDEDVQYSSRTADTAEKFTAVDTGDFFNERSYLQGVTISYRTWKRITGSRSVNGAIIPSWADMIAVWRCDRLFSDNHEMLWRLLAISAHEVYGEPQPQVGWERRRAFCTRHAEQVLEDLRNAPLKGNPRIPDLIRFYDDQLNLYQD